jgi:hypothetical protein
MDFIFVCVYSVTEEGHIHEAKEAMKKNVAAPWNIYLNEYNEIRDSPELENVG